MDGPRTSDDRERVSRNINAAIESGDEHWASEYHFRRADGSYASVYDPGLSLRDTAGKPLRMIGALMDISTLKRTKKCYGRRKTGSRLSWTTAPLSRS